MVPMAGDEGDPIRVLHVDDEPDLVALVSTFLERIDDRLVVETETSARDGLDRLFDSGAEFDCVVSDHDMPGMDGQAFLEAVRERRPDLPFILFTGKGSEDIASQAISAGVTDYLRKGAGTDQYQLLANQIDNAVTRDRTRDRLQKTKERADVLLEDSPVMITVSVDGECRFINRAGVELLGAESRDAVVGRDFLDLVHPPEAAQEEAIFRPGSEDEEGVANLERRLRSLDGQTKYVEVTARPIVFGGEDAVVAIVKDVTDRKRREDRLRQRERQFRSMAENFPKGMVFLFDEDLRYTVAKGQGLAEVGLDSYDLEGETIFESLPAELCEAFEPRYRRALAGAQDVFELSYEDHVFRVHTLPVRDKHGDVFAGMHIAPDITRERRRVDELEVQNDRLTEFSRVISHDLRNPLNIASGQLELARETGDDEALGAVAEALDRMDALIEDVLSLARSGLTIDEVEPVSLETTVADAWQQVRSNGTRLQIDGDLQIEADASRLQELLGNLFRNTMEHARTERRIRVGPLDDGFYIEDDGAGIREEDREAVFETGYSTDEDGTGFGLAIVEQIAVAHGWDVSICAGPSGGTQFNITGVEITEPSG